MILTVWYPGPRDSNVFADLARAIDPHAVLTQDEPDACDILIEGRPKEEQLNRVRQGGAVIVPFAGVPPATAELLKTRKNLTLHNLHHNAPETAETAIALLLAASRRIVTADQALRKGNWTPRYTPEECVRLEGMKAVVLGMGSIGTRVAIVLDALGVNVVGIRRHLKNAAEEALRALVEGPGIETVSFEHFEEVLQSANILMITLPQTKETENLITQRHLEALKKPSILVNVARAQIVNEKDLYEALKEKILHAAGCDVWYRYPKHPEGIVPGYFEMPEEAKHTFPSEYPFHELDNLVMSPHRGGASAYAERARVEHLAMLIRARATTGEMPNRVDLDAGY